MNLPSKIDGAVHALGRIAGELAPAGDAFASLREKQAEQVAQEDSHRVRHSSTGAGRLALTALALATCPAMGRA